MVIGANCASTEAKGRTDVRIITAACTLDVNDQVGIITNGTYAVTLPDVAAAAGRIYSFRQPGAGTGDVTIIPKVDYAAYSQVAIATIDAPGENAVIYSDGISWHLLSGAAA